MNGNIRQTSGEDRLRGKRKSRERKSGLILRDSIYMLSNLALNEVLSLLIIKLPAKLVESNPISIGHMLTVWSGYGASPNTELLAPEPPTTYLSMTTLAATPFPTQDVYIQVAYLS
jgi:hypothetical protein